MMKLENKWASKTYLLINIETKQLRWQKRISSSLQKDKYYDWKIMDCSDRNSDERATNAMRNLTDITVRIEKRQ